MKDELQGYSNSRNCTEAEQKLTVALWYILIIMVRIKVNYTTKSKSYTIMKNTADLQT